LGCRGGRFEAEARSVLPARQLDQHTIVGTIFRVIRVEFCAHPTGLDANDWIDARVVFGRWAAKDFDPDYDFLDFVGKAAKGFLRNKVKKPPKPLGLGELATCQDTRDLRAHRLGAHAPG